MKSSYEHKKSIILDITHLEAETERECQLNGPQMMSKPPYPTLEDTQKYAKISYNSPVRIKKQPVYSQSLQNSVSKKQFVSKIPRISSVEKRVTIPKLALSQIKNQENTQAIEKSPVEKLSDMKERSRQLKKQLEDQMTELVELN